MVVFLTYSRKRGRSTAVMYKYHFAALLVLLASCALHSRSFYTRGGGGIVLFWIQFDFWALKGQRAMEQPPIARDTPPLLAGLPASHEGLGKSRVTKTGVPTPTIRRHPSKDHTRRRFLAATIRRRREPAKRCWGPRAELPAFGDLDRKRENQKGRGGPKARAAPFAGGNPKRQKKSPRFHYPVLCDVQPTISRISGCGPSLVLEGAARAFNGRPCAYGMAWHGMAWRERHIHRFFSSLSYLFVQEVVAMQWHQA
ncbi:hypothetical protein GGI43DRAFT_284542 [Trichoderma evansii]